MAKFLKLLPTNHHLPLKNNKNIGLQFLARGLSISHEIRMKSGGFHVKSTGETEEFLLKHLNL